MFLYVSLYPYCEAAALFLHPVEFWVRNFRLLREVATKLLHEAKSQPNLMKFPGKVSIWFYFTTMEFFRSNVDMDADDVITK